MARDDARWSGCYFCRTCSRLNPCNNCGEYLRFQITNLAAERDRYKAEMKYLAELLEDSNVTICKLCKRLNPQHENCTGCSDLKTRIAALAKIKEAGE